MLIRRLTILVVVLALGGILATPAAAQQPSPGGPDAQVNQYVEPEVSVGEAPPGQPPGEVGQAGDLAFTGLVILPLAMLGIALILGALALRRRRARVPATS
jgi:hypothetical protein